MVWDSQLFQNFPQFIVIHTIKSFGIVNKAKIVQCHKPCSIVHQAFCVSDLVSYIYFSLPLDTHKGFDLGHN